MYRELTTLVHSYLNQYAHINNIGKFITARIDKIQIYSLGCTNHKKEIYKFCIKLILRMHIHNWCKIINRMLKGDLEEKYVKKNGSTPFNANGVLKMKI